MYEESRQRLLPSLLLDLLAWDYPYYQYHPFIAARVFTLNSQVTEYNLLLGKITRMGKKTFQTGPGWRNYFKEGA
jgi:hypothetical protein